LKKGKRFSLHFTFLLTIDEPLQHEEQIQTVYLFFMKVNLYASKI